MHHWFKDVSETPDRYIFTIAVERLRNFHNMNSLQRLTLTVMAGQQDESGLRSLRDAFCAIDVNGNGTLTAKELKEALKKMKLKIPPDLESALDAVDEDHDGQIDWEELLAATMDRRALQQENACWEAFKVFDKDNNQKISAEELSAVLADGDLQANVDEEVRALLAEVDKDADGFISFEEFCTVLRSANTRPAGVL
jgi:Ca2+-binding EF-hand superfamily protein